MTSFRQIEANRRNAAKSTGPNTGEGKHRSRQNAVRQGPCAETVVEAVEDIDDYRGFEAAIIADYDARTAVERESMPNTLSIAVSTPSPAISDPTERIRCHTKRQRTDYGGDPQINLRSIQLHDHEIV